VINAPCLTALALRPAAAFFCAAAVTYCFTAFFVSFKLYAVGVPLGVAIAAAVMVPFLVSFELVLLLHPFPVAYALLHVHHLYHTILFLFHSHNYVPHFRLSGYFDIHHITSFFHRGAQRPWSNARHWRPAPDPLSDFPDIFFLK